MTNQIQELSIELTHKCSLNCTYCSSDSSFEIVEFINFDRLIETIEEVHSEFNLKVVSLSGGETFLYPQFFKLFRYLMKKKIKVIIYTSGVIINEAGIHSSINNEIVDLLSKYSKDVTVIVNIQGYNKKSIERINLTPGSYEYIEQSIYKLLSNGISVQANIVPFKLNYKNLKNVVKFCIGVGMHGINFLRYVPQGRGSNQKLFNSKKEFKKINEKIIHIIKKNDSNNSPLNIRVGHPINFFFLLGADKIYSKEKNHYCRGGLDAPLILPDGNVSMCPAWKNLPQFYAGSIYSQSFSDIWFSVNFSTFRDFINKNYKNLKSPCKVCEFLEECRGKCVAQRILSFSNTEHELKKIILIGPDPQCFKKH